MSGDIVRDLNADEQAFLDHWRTQLRMALPEQERHLPDTTFGKLTVIQVFLKQITAKDIDLLRGLGVLFGDALAIELNLNWAMITDRFGQYPAVIRRGTSFSIAALNLLEKRVLNGEVPIDVGALFGALCDSGNRVLQPKKSLWGRVFGSRLT